LGLIPGEWVCLGDDTVITQFANAAEQRPEARQVAMDNSSIVFDKSTVAMVADSGDRQDRPRVLWSRASRTKWTTLVVRQAVQFERTLGAPDTSSTAPQAEYLTSSIADKFELTVKTADKITAKLNFMSSDQETRTAGRRPQARRPSGAA
jgi:hypothetical protein